MASKATVNSKVVVGASDVAAGPKGPASGADDEVPVSPIIVASAELTLATRETERGLSQVPAAANQAASRVLAAAATKGTTTLITWAWGTNPVLKFNPTTDRLNFNSLAANEFQVADGTGSTVISLLNNNHTYTLSGVTVSQLSMSNIVAKNAGAVAKWQSLISSAQAAVLPSVSIASAGVTEGNSGTTNAMFTVTLSKASKTAVTVRYSTSNGTATAGQDYTAASGTITFAPGVTSRVAAVAVLGDSTVEPNETFSVNLSSPSGVKVAAGTATGTIVNDDVAVVLPTVSIANATVNESNSGTANAAFTVTLSKASKTAVTVRYATSNGTATAGQDYTAASGTITFAPGVTSQVANIGVLGDATVESNETFTVTLSGASGATVAAATATGTIVNDDTTAPPSDQWGNAFFAPYVAMENYPTPNLQQLANASGADKVVIGFIQADSTGEAAWGGYSVLQPDSTNAQAKAINASIAQFQAAGGDAMISFGGAVGTSLWEHYSANGLGAQALANTYGGIVDTYGVDHLDFDIEAGGVSNRTAVDLNSQALKLLQQARPNLTVWYTLGAGPSGLYTDSVYAVESGLKAGVKVDGVNIMAMDFGEAAAPTSGPNAQTMGTWAIRSAQSTYNQMATLYTKYGKSFGWKNLGVTPMIGVNDVKTEIFTVADAQALEDFARTKGIGMLSMWSLLRDNPGNIGQVTGNTSGTNAAANSYSKVYDDYGVINA